MNLGFKLSQGFYYLKEKYPCFGKMLCRICVVEKELNSYSQRECLGYEKCSKNKCGFGKRI
ncbi:MAG: hypothetical protein E7271_00075 [Lachnospiraceae bacterium]|nr:hypothetical protein [Lachnospiraceae bacterium]